MKFNVFIPVLLLFPLFLGAQQDEKQRINTLLTQWHQAAAEADFEGYFSRMSPGAVFVGTDASEVWGKEEFMAFSKPYFDRGAAWDFTAVQRNIYLEPGAEVAWFDELLDTWMLLCRGSGVVKKVAGEWQIAHYVLSMTIPNDEVQGAVALKKAQDSLTMKSLRSLTKPE